MKNCRPAPRTEAGFTYLWVLLVVALLGTALALGAELHTTSVQRDKEKELLAVGHQFRAALGRYFESQFAGGTREYPLSLDDLLKDKRSPGMQRYLRQVFVDPMTGKAEWGLVRLGGRIVGVHSLSEKMPIKQANFEAEDAGFAGKARYADWVFVYPPDLPLSVGPQEGG